MRHQHSWITLCFILLMAGTASAQNPADGVAEMGYYLPEDVRYDASIPTPEEVLGMVPGEWHVSHDQLVRYMYALAEASDRITIKEFGRTYENRPLIYLTITSPRNHSSLEQIRQNHLALTRPSESKNMKVEEMPIVLYMGYSIHGNEASGSNAALLVAYHLAAAQGREINRMLDNSVILLDPSFNPDGLNRFASWVNTRRSRHLVTDPNSMEFDEVWPGGRTNHYWFDLNRDWMPVQHPESQGRIELFHHWKPNIVTDHHEMGTNTTFFFQPGIPSRTHPLTPELNQQLTSAIAEYHADILDQDQRLYYSEESFDDFYYGKGSTYPDINGSIGILFEQASSRGHAQESDHGVLTFPFTIKNHFLASLSTMKAGQSLRTAILNYQRGFYREAASEAARSSIQAYVYGSPEDRARTYHFTEILRRHEIEVYELREAVESNGRTFEPGSAYIIPADQQQYRFITSLFERRTTFADSLFYDVSAWTMPYAFNLPFAELGGRQYSRNLLGDAVGARPEFPSGTVVGGKSNYAYLFEWDEYYAPRALNRFMKAGVRVKVAAKPFETVVANGSRKFDYGTILVPIGPQDVSSQVIHKLAQQAAREDGLAVYAVNSGLTHTGMDLGSRNFVPLKQPKVALLAGKGVSSYEVGEVWHLLDQRYHMTPTLLDVEDVGGINLGRYNVIVMVSGGYSGLSEQAADRLKAWVRDGGTLIATKHAISWAKRNGLANIRFADEKENGDKDEEGSGAAGVTPRPYADMNDARGAQVIGGSIFHARLDLTHPLGYGYNSDSLTVFRNSTLFMQKAENPYATPLYYTEQPLAAGYISEENLEKLSGTAAIVVSGHGRGKVISMTDNSNFRAFWFGTNKLFMNAIFFGQTISGGSVN